MIAVLTWGQECSWLISCQIMKPKGTITLKLKDNPAHSFI